MVSRSLVIKKDNAIQKESYFKNSNHKIEEKKYIDEIRMFGQKYVDDPLQLLEAVNP